MHGYELRLVDTASRDTVQAPAKRVRFEAADDYAAINHLHHYATTIPAHVGVWLVPDGQTASIASEQGSAQVTV